MKLKMRNIILITIIVLTILILYGFFIEAKNYKIKEYVIKENIFDSKLTELTIVQLSDIHYGTSIKKKELKKIINDINMVKPNILVLTGDLVDTSLNEKQYNELKEIFGLLNSSIIKLAINGNHDTEYDKWELLINDIKFLNINDSYKKIYTNELNSILFIGLSDSINDSRNFSDKLNNVINSIEEDSNTFYKILLMHEPDYIDEIPNNYFNIVLAGHSHNGQVRIPFIGATYRPIGCKKYYKELYEINNTKLFISNGLGTTFIPIRLFNPPSFSIFRLTSK